MYFISAKVQNYNPEDNTFDIEIPEFDDHYKGKLTGFYWLNPDDYQIILESGYDFNDLLSTNGLPIIDDDKDVDEKVLEAVMNGGIILNKLTRFFNKLHEGLDMVRQEMFEFTDNDIKIEVES